MKRGEVQFKKKNTAYGRATVVDEKLNKQDIYTGTPVHNDYTIANEKQFFRNSVNNVLINLN